MGIAGPHRAARRQGMGPFVPARGRGGRSRPDAGMQVMCYGFFSDRSSVVLVGNEVFAVRRLSAPNRADGCHQVPLTINPDFHSHMCSAILRLD